MTQLTASVESVPDALILRIHPEGGALGDPWSWSCVVIRDPENPDIAIIKAAPRAATREEREAIKRALVPLGYRGVRWERIKNGKSHWTTIFRSRHD